VPGAAKVAAAPAEAPRESRKPDSPKEVAGEARPAAVEPPSPRQAIAPAVAGIRKRAGAARKHAPPGKPVASAQAAALTPATEQKRSAAEQTVTRLDDAGDKAKKVQRDAFKAKLRKAIDDATPKPRSKSEAEKLMKTGGAKASGELRSNLETERNAAAGPIASAAGSEVSAASQPAPPHTDLQIEPAGAPPPAVSPESVVPAPLPPERLDYSSDRAPTDRAMAENGVTKEQLEKGNEPAFGPTLEARSTAEQHEAAAEAKYRGNEQKVADVAHGRAQASIAKGLDSIHDSRSSHFAGVAGHQVATKLKNAAERQRITETIAGIKDKTRADVEQILVSMETEASAIFEAGLKRAEHSYGETFEEAKGGWGTWLTTWGDDWEELIENSLGKARVEYMRQVDVAIEQVADCVDAKLSAAKKRVAAGRTEVERFVGNLSDSVRGFGEEALQNVSADFDAMGTEIDQRRDGLVDRLAQQYKASYERMSAMEEKLREANKSLWQRVYDATVGLIKKIIAFKDMLLGVLRKAASMIAGIIADPVGFLGNLVTGVMTGLKNFMANIATHLKKGLLEWLFGALGGAGLQMPETFDLKGIVSIVLQVLGLTYANFRARAVSIVGEPVVAALEKAAEVFRIIRNEGIAGLWRFIKEKVDDLKSMVMDGIFDYLKEKVLIAGVTWLIGLLNPVSAFFKACKAIYDIIKFFIERGSQIITLVNAIIDSIVAIASGNLSAAIDWVEKALAKAIPVAIGFLASLLGLGDISGTIRKLIDRAQAPINKAIDWVINNAVAVVKKLGRLIVQAGVPEDPNERLRLAANAAVIAAQKLTGTVTKALLQPVLNVIKLRYGLTDLTPFESDGFWWVEASINPKLKHNLGIRAMPNAPALVPSQLQPMKRITVSFTCNTAKYDSAVYLKQLKGQEAGINVIPVAEWVQNREAYKQYGRGSAVSQEKAREWLREELLKRMTPAQADAELELLAALHEPDLVAGGRLTVGKLGSRYINSSIGSQWRTRAAELYDTVVASVPAVDRPKYRMNVLLTLEDI
jgi:hypothetical protein